MCLAEVPEVVRSTGAESKMVVGVGGEKNGELLFVFYFFGFAGKVPVGEGHRTTWGFSFYHMGLREGTQTIRLSFIPLSQLKDLGVSVELAQLKSGKME